MKLKHSVIAALALSLSCGPALAQSANGRVTAAAPTYAASTLQPLSLDTGGALRVVNSGAPSGTQDVNLTKIGGVALAYGQQVMASSIPVTLASNQSALAVTGTFFQATQPVSIASAQVASGAYASGAFASGAFASGSVASGAFASGALASGSIAAGAFTAGQPAQANWGHGATGAAPPAGAQYVAANTGAATTGGKLTGLITCDNHVFKHITSATDTLAVQGVASQTIYICGWRSRAAGTATWFLENTASTNANCASANTQLTGVATEVANSGEVLYSPIWGGLKNTVSNGLCINSTGTGGVDVDIFYTQF